MIIIDTSLWVSFLNPADSNHDRAKQIFLSIKAKEIIVFDYIYTESMTVFRSKVADEYCIRFTQFLRDWQISIFFIDQIIVRLANIYFFQFKKLSFTDCLILASAKINNYELSTFDNALEKAATIAMTK